MKGRTRDISPESDREIRALVSGFVRSDQQDRYLAKPQRFYADLCHKLPNALSPKFAVAVSPAVPQRVLVIFVQHSLRVDRCYYLGQCPILAEGSCSVDEAIAAVDSYADAVASFLPGEAAYYKSESDEQIFLLRDPALRERLNAAIQQSTRAAEATRAPRTRRGSR
ncbi:MAG: hypothetical protein K2Y21_15635 [Phycisphaerales bacterium]|nr:hypothetical protein [Phycisphaerales bacterium]